MENEILYGPHNINDVDFSKFTSPEPSQAPAGPNLEYLEKLSSILDRMEKLEAFVAMDDERRKQYEQQRKADITALNKAADDLSHVNDKIWDAGKYTDEMVQEVLEAKKGVPVKMTDEFMEFWNALPSKLGKEFLDLLRESLDKKLADFQKKVEETLTSYDKVSTDCDTKLSNVKSALASIDGKIIFPSHTFWGMVAAFFVVAIFGLYGGWLFQGQPGNKELLYYMGIALIINFIFITVTTIQLKKDKDNKDDSQDGVFKMSFCQLLYMMLMATVLVIYGTWWLVDGDSLPFLKWLLPVAFMTNFWWFLMKYIIIGIFQRS